MAIDLNCDMGESFGIYTLGADERIMPWITSANIACGAHAGDPAVMRRTVALCLRHGVAIGAHPGLPDLIGFGRREMRMAPEEIAEWTLYQIGALHGFVRSEGASLAHVKPHGALYHMLEASEAAARAFVEAVARFDPGIAVVGLAGGRLVRAAREAGLTALDEGFADRGYAEDGTLAPRGTPGAVITDPEAAAAQALALARNGILRRAPGGEARSVRIDTLCIHGDAPRADEKAEAISRKLAEHGLLRARPPRGG